MEHVDHILVVDDDRDIRELVTEYLIKSGYRATGAANGKEMRAVLGNSHIDLVVLDIMMPGDDGLTLCRQLRNDTQQNLPILMLTARNEDSDRILGLEMGADDYLVKPFIARELLARIKAILRRTRALPPNLQITAPNRVISFGDWQLDTTARHLLDPAGTVVALSGAEYRLLQVFLDHPQRVLSRDQLLNLTQGRDAELFERSIDLLVSRLRQRLGDDAREPACIKTVRSEGYVLAMPVKVQETSQ
ncbi:response regulator [Pantoea sp. A4]|uniref:response regulator n=1 Tax=Pantoea sp. A4 TaxID=1225184 RepID=UPI00037DEA36|nr:response regulator [Pantoea sp. A4]